MAYQTRKKRKGDKNMTLSKQTLDHLLEAEGSIRAAIKFAAVNEKPLVVTQISKILYEIDHIKSFEQLQDVIETHMKGKEE